MSDDRTFRNVRRRKRRFHGNKYTGKVDEELQEPTSGPSSSKAAVGTSQPLQKARAEPSTSKISPDAAKSEKIAVSARKLKEAYESVENSDSSDDSCSSDSEDEFVGAKGFCLVDMSILAAVIEMFWCPKCKSGHTVLLEKKDSKKGFASLFEIQCKARNCSFSKRFYSSKTSETDKSFEVNRRAVLAARNVGVGHRGLVKFAGTMNMRSPMNANSYRDHVKAICNAARVVAETSMEKASSELKEFYEADDNGIYDIGVSGDGSWRRRGFSSLYGVVTALSLMTGKVIDTEVMSKECKECMGWKGKEDSLEFDHWWEGHQHSCNANYFGSSGSMDSAGCVAIFQRSVEKYGMRYLEFLGDGDSKSHSVLVEEAVYGDKVIEKLECVGHVQKRMGSRLRSLKRRSGKTKLKDGKCIGGKGRLTDKVIDNLQVYYGKAIRNNTHSIEDMKNAIMATWNHIRSTDENPCHDLCPSGKDSWCGFQRDTANGTSNYNHQNPLPEAVSDEIYPTFIALSKTDLLKSCLHGGTQNQNEAFNALIWQRATKETHSGLPTVELATYLAVGHFNDGAEHTICLILEHLGILPGKNCKKSCKKLDQDRIRHSVRKSTEQAKKRRRKIRHQKKGFGEAQEEREGPMYEAGAF